MGLRRLSSRWTWPLLVAAVTAAACGGSLAPQRPQPAPAAPTEVTADTPVHLETSEGPVQVTVLADGLIRVTLRKDAKAKPLESFAVDPEFEPALPSFTVKRHGGTTTILTQRMGLAVQESPLAITQLDADGKVVLRQSGDGLWTGAGPHLAFSLDEGERVFGLGDKAKGHDRRGHQFEMWNTDAFGWQVGTDPLYKSFPVLVFVHEGTSHGIFVDSPTRAQVDVGKANPSKLTYEMAEGNAVDLYLLAGPEPKQVIESYTKLTGRTPLPPYWSLGFHMCRYGYLTEDEVRGVVSRFRRDRLPVDTIWLDIDFQDGNAPFTVNRKAFPKFREMLADFTAQGVHTVVITDPHLKSYQGKKSPSGYVPYDQGAAGDHFLRVSENRFYEGKVWPGKAVFPEFTLSRTRAWWGTLYEGFLNDGVAGFWNDMNEPAIFDVASKTMPRRQTHRLDDGSTVSHQVAHNAYGALNVRATFEGVSRLRPNQRPFTLTRAAYAGAQRYSASWTGDNRSTREHLAATIPTLTNLGVSGYGYVGADVGGFEGCPSPELLVEWMELGAFQPFYRNHSNRKTCRREPWVHGAAIEDRTRRAIERRYRFLPYIYTAFEEMARTGAPMMRPLWFEYPADETVATNDRVFLVGRDLLVAPQLVAGAKSYRVQLPQSGFYDMTTGALHERGGQVTVPASAGDSIRLFARAGAIIPLAPVVQHSGQKPAGPLVIEVFPGQDCRGSLYVDDGSTLEYRQGEIRRWALSCTPSASGIEISAMSGGEYPVWWSSVQLVVHGVSNAPKSLTHVKAGALRTLYDEQTRTVRATFDNDGSGFSVSGTW